MNFRLLAISSWLIVITCFLFAADISAPKMEIVDTPEGRTTVFPQGITIIDKDNNIKGKYAVFYERDNKAKISDSVIIITPQLHISADTVIYYFDNKSSNLKSNVIVESETLKIETNNLIFEQSKNIVKTDAGIKIREKLQRLTIFGTVAEYNFTNDAGTIESLPVVYIEREDTTEIRSRKMILENNQSQFLAIDRVSATAGNTILKCETLLFFIKEDSGIALVNPVIFDKDNQIKGNLIKFYFQADDSSKSKELETELKTVKIINEAQAHYITSNQGVLDVSGTLFTLNYIDGDIENIKIYGDSMQLIHGTFIPKEEL